MTKQEYFDEIYDKYNNYFKKACGWNKDLYQELLYKIFSIDWDNYDNLNFNLIKTIVKNFLISKSKTKEAKRAEKTKFESELINVETPAENLFISPINIEEVLVKLIPYTTDRQRDILKSLAEGYSNIEIADILDINEKTVRRDLKALETQQIWDIISNTQ